MGQKFRWMARRLSRARQESRWTASRPLGALPINRTKGEELTGETAMAGEPDEGTVTMDAGLADKKPMTLDVVTDI